ncbi:phage major capsid protein [Streptomyces sp. NPDC050507]|uniref:phage major capsid protein n=1 Tax=Streptomyces sp. NPDC050507 TaxID=3365619 RepID=UPI003799F6B6
MSFIDLAKKALESRARLYEEYKSIAADEALSDAERRERLERIDTAITDKGAEVRDFTAKAEQEKEQREAVAKFGALFAPAGEAPQEAPADEMRAILMDVAQGIRRDVLLEARAPGANVSAKAGTIAAATFAGNTTSVQFIAQVLESLRERSPFLGIVETFTTSNGETIRYPVKNARPLTTDVAVLAEGDKIPFTNESFGTYDLGARKYGVGAQLSTELITDSEVDIAGIVATDVGEALADRLAADFLAKMQTRVTNKVVQSGALAANTTVSYDQLIDLEHALRTGYRRAGTWFMSDAQLAQVRKLKSGEGIPLWQPALTLGAPDTMLGHALYTDASITTKAGGAVNTDFLWFGDFKAFKVRQVKGLTVSRSDEYAWDSDMVSWKVTWRGDGDLFDLAAVAALRTPAT